MTVKGDRNIVVAAPVNDSIIISGDNNTVEMRLSGNGALLAHAFRWDRPRPRRRRERPVAPPPFEHHVDREADIAALVGSDGMPRVSNLYGSKGIGKTHVVVAALNRRGLEARDGTLYLHGRGRDSADCLHAIFDALFESRVPLRDQRVGRHLADRRAIVALEDVALEPDDAQDLTQAAPRCRFILTSAERVLYSGPQLALAGLADEYVVAIAEQELGRALSGRERAAAHAVGAALGGHPLALRQTFHRAREQGMSLEALAPRAAAAYDEPPPLPASEAEVARVLAVHGDAAVGLEHVEALAGPDARSAARELEARHQARSHSPRYSLVGATAEAFSDKELSGEIERALEYFAAWAEAEARDGRRERVLAEADALVALLVRAQRLDRHEEVVRLGLAIEWALAWGNRWQAWGRVLELVLGSARAADDVRVEAWALHQLGTRHYGIGNAAAAAVELQRALAMRERIGDDAGAAATRQNLGVVQGRPPLLQRISHLSTALLGAIVALLIVGAVATGAAVLDGPPDVIDRETVALSIAVTGNGRGTVVSGDREIRCADTCDLNVDKNRRIVLYAHSTSSRFDGWGGACTGARGCALPMTSDSRVTATFSRIDNPRRLSVDVTGAGRVTSVPVGIDCPGSCSAAFARGRSVRLVADPATRVTWSGACTESGPCEVVMTEDSSVGARFASSPASKSRLSVKVRGSGSVAGPEIDCKPDCSASFERGRTVVLRAEDGRETFDRWEGACSDTEGASCELQIDGDTRVTAVFEDAPKPETVSLTLHTDGTGTGTIDYETDCEPGCTLGELEPRTVVTLTATADSTSTFTGWSEPDCPGIDPCVVTVDVSKDVTAHFDENPPVRLSLKVGNRPDPNPLTVSVDEEEQPECVTSCSFPRGTVVTITSSESPESWGGCDGNPPAEAPCTVTMSKSRTVSVSFPTPVD